MALRLSAPSASRVAATTRITALAAAVAVGGASYADENWSLQPSLNQAGTWSSNPSLLSRSHEALYGSITSPSLTFTTATPTTTFNASAKADVGIYNQPSFNSNDFHGDIGLRTRTERWLAGISAHSDLDTTRASELTTLNSVTFGNTRHLGYSVSPSIAFLADERNKITLVSSYSKSQYDGNSIPDYHIYSITPSYQYNVTELLSAVFSVGARRYQNDGVQQTRTDSYFPTLGLVQHFTPTLTGELHVGEQRYRSSTPGVKGDWQWKPIYSASLTSKTDSNSLSFTAKRDLQPYINGKDTFLNTLSLTNDYHINPLLTASLGTSYQFADKHDKSANTLESLGSANAGLSYSITQDVSVSTSYRFRQQKISSLSGSQSDNQVMVGLVLRPVLPFLNAH